MATRAETAGEEHSQIPAAPSSPPEEHFLLVELDDAAALLSRISRDAHPESRRQSVQRARRSCTAVSHVLRQSRFEKQEAQRVRESLSKLEKMIARLEPRQ